MIAAMCSASGKTSITAALLQNLKNRNINTVSFKCGPDYIDPLFHKNVLGVPSYNLDTFFTDAKETERIFNKHSKKAQMAVIEGVMGLFDGVGGVLEEGSSYHLAKVTKTPVILVVNAKGMGRSVIAAISGFLSFDKDDLIKGVILNRVSGSYFNTIAPLIEKELNIKVVGFMSDRKDLNISSRHLGLTTPDDCEKFDEILEKLSGEFSDNVSFEKIMEIASIDVSPNKEPDEEDDTFVDPKEIKCTIAVAKDEAFCFIYEDNIALLRENGARIVYFSPIRDKCIPKDADAILLPGGYPELHLDKLSQNVSMLDSIKNAYEKGIPVVAECGGFMYLHETVEDTNKNKFKLVGAVKGNCVYKGRSVRFGYVGLKEKRSNFTDGKVIRAHEFHYYDSDRNGEDVIAVKPYSKKEYDCITDEGDKWLGFAHLYYPSNPSFAENFVKKAYDYSKKKTDPEV